MTTFTAAPDLETKPNTGDLVNRLARTTVLRILAPGQQAVDHPLVQGKTTLGSSPRCTIRLARPSVQPLHCVFNSDESNSTVTGWAAGIRLNSEELRKSDLRPGDILHFGDVTIAALDEQGASTPSEDLTALWQGPMFRVSNGNAGGASQMFEQPAFEENHAANSVDALGNSRIAHLRSANQNARRRCRRLADGLREARKQTGDLTNEVASLEHRLGESWQQQQQQQELCEHLQAEVAEASANSASSDEVNRLAEQFSTVQGELEQARRELAERNENCQNLAAQLGDLQQDRQELLDRLEGREHHDGELMAAVAERDQQLERLRQDLEAADSARAASDQALSEQSEQLNVLQQELDAACTRRDELSATSESLAERLAELERSESDRRDLQQQVESTHQELAQLQQSCEQQQFEVEELRRTASQLQDEKTRLESELADQRSRAEELTSQLTESQHGNQVAIEEAESRSRDLAAELEDLTVRLNEATAAGKVSEAEFDEMRAARDAWVFEKEALQAEVVEKDERIAELYEQLAAAQGDANLLRENCQANEAEIERLQEAVAAAGSASDEQLAAVAEQVDSLALQLQASRDEGAAAQLRSDELQQRYDAAAADLEAARAALLTVESQLIGNGATEAQQPIGPGEQTASEREFDHSSSDPVESAEADNEMHLADDGSAAKVGSVEVGANDDADDQTKDDANEALARLREMAVWSDADTGEESTEGDEGDAGESDPHEATSFIDQFKHLLPEDDDPIDPVPSAPTSLSPTAGVPLPGDDDEDSEALEAYMSQMMQRMRGGEPVAGANPAMTAKSMGRLTKPITASAAETQTVPTEPVEPINLEQLRLSTCKPALASDLNAMRELANKSARKAISTSRKRRHFEVALSKLLICLFATPSCIYAALTAKSYFSPYFLGGCVAGFAGVYAGFQFLGVLLRAIRDGSWDGEKVESQAAVAAEELPIGGGEAETDRVAEAR